MEDIVDLGENSQRPATRLPLEVDCEWGSEYADDQPPVHFPGAAAGGGLGAGRVHGASRSSTAPSQSGAALPHKVRGPNWTEAEMLVLIGQKRIEWDSRHNCNQPSLAKFV